MGNVVICKVFCLLPILFTFFIYQSIVLLVDLCSDRICNVQLNIERLHYLNFPCLGKPFLFFFFFLINLFVFGCVGFLPLGEGPLQLWQAGATLHRGARASHCRGLPRCGAQAPNAQAQSLWPMGPVAPRHAGSSQTRARTRVPCIGRQIPNHCATREAHGQTISYQPQATGHRPFSNTLRPTSVLYPCYSFLF